MDGDREKFLAAGMGAYASKPFDPKKIFSIISTLVTQRDAPEPAGGTAMPRPAAVLGMFVDSTPGELRELRAAVEDGDLEAAGNIAHKLKTGSAYLGAMKLSALLEAFESAAMAELADEAAPLVDRLDAVYAETETALRRVI